MRDGKIVQVGTSEDILTHPANDYVSDFIENVNRGTVITASSIMLRHPVLARFPNDGPKVTERKMRRNNLPVIPVVDKEEVLLGEISIEDVVRLQKEGKNSIETAINKNNFSVGPDALLEDLLPLLIQTNFPISVVDDEGKILGLILLSRLIVETTGKDKKEIDQLIKNSREL